MRMYLAAIGSRGDYEPFRTLAEAASRAGHDVHFAHTADFAADNDAPYSSHLLPGSFEAMLSEGFSFTKSVASYRTVIKPMLEGIYRTSTTQIVSLKPDVVVYHPKVMTAATAAHYVGALAVMAELVPTLTPTKDFPPAGLPLRLPPQLNRASYAIVAAGLSSFGDPAKKLADDLGVSRSTPDMSLCPESPAIVPQPADWPPHATITGPWLSSTSSDDDPQLDAFLSGKPTVYAGFGSMNDGESHARARATTILSAARHLGYQTLFVTGWGGLSIDETDAQAPDVLIRQSVHHESVFPRVTLAIHHGGAGTTQRALLSATPSVILPFLADQPWWANRLHSQHLGPPAVRKRNTNPATLISALRMAADAQDTVTSAAEAMSKENGPEASIRLIEESVGRRNPDAPS